MQNIPEFGETLMITPEEAAADLGISRAKLYALMHDAKDFPFVRCGRRYMIPRDQFREWVMGGQGAAEKSSPYCMKIRVDGDRVYVSLWERDREIEHGSAFFRNDIDDPDTRLAQAVSYAAHTIFKRTQESAVYRGAKPFRYQRFTEKEGA